MTASMRAVKLWSPVVASETRPDGTILVWREDPLGPYPEKITERLVHWAHVAPDRPWMAQRDGEEWRTVSYGECLSTVRRIGQALLSRGLSAERPLAILSGNGVRHALLALAAQYVGVPSAALSPAYSLVSKDHAKLKDIAAQLTPGLVYAEDGAAFAPAIAAAFPGVPVVVGHGSVPGHEVATFDDLAATEPTEAVDRAHDAVGPDTVAKFLFTSGTTGSPKAVIQTQRLLCANQAMVQDAYAFAREEPPVLVDWAPWNHTAAGNKNFNFVLYNGGTYYIDEGKPTPAGIGETIRNLSEISPTWHLNVPAGYEMLTKAMETDKRLAETFFAQMKVLVYAGAGMAQHVWDAVNRLSEETIGERVLLTAGYGATETGPFALGSSEPQERPGNIGIPVQGVTLKLVPNGDKLEARLKGPSITPGYWRNPELTAAAFDEEGFYRMGDAFRFAVPGKPASGFFFDGRVAENFKLATGTWVAVGPLRAKLVDEMGGLVRDVVLAGEDREELGALLVPFFPALRDLAPSGADLSDAELLSHPAVRAAVADRLATHAAAATGSASRVTRAIFLEEEPSFDRGELTDKGSINQRAVLAHRADLVEALYSDDPRVIVAAKGQIAA